MTQELRRNGLENVINEYYGRPYWNKPIYFESKQNEDVVLIPFEKEQQTSAILLIVKSNNQLQINFVERGNIYKNNQANVNNRPDLERFAEFFNSFDQALFQKPRTSLSKLIGRKNNGRGESRNISLNGETFNEKNEWGSNDVCTDFWMGTVEDPYQYYMYTECETEWYWIDSGLGETLIFDVNLDGGMGSGGGGSGTEFVSPMCNYWGQMGLSCDEMEAFEQDYRSKMSDAELEIFDNLNEYKKALYLANAQLALNYANKHFPSSVYNGKGDAVRHALFHAAVTIDLGQTISKQLGDAHENRPPNYVYEWKEVTMDLHNNAVGREWSNWLERGFSSLHESILSALNTGELVYLNNLDSNGRATAQSVLVKSNQ